MRDKDAAILSAAVKEFTAALSDDLEQAAHELDAGASIRCLQFGVVVQTHFERGYRVAVRKKGGPKTGPVETMGTLVIWSGQDVEA